jgi:hypothetical protein
VKIIESVDGVGDPVNEIDPIDEPNDPINEPVPTTYIKAGAFLSFQD